MFDTVECPYCEHENDMSDGCIDLPNDNKFDHECENCEQEFEVVEEVIIDLCNEKGVGPVMQEKIRAALGKIPRRVQVGDNDFK